MQALAAQTATKGRFVNPELARSRRREASRRRRTRGPACPKSKCELSITCKSIRPHRAAVTACPCRRGDSNDVPLAAMGGTIGSRPAWTSCPFYLQHQTSSGPSLHCPFGARNEILHRGYSITSSARASSGGGIVRPSAFAVLRLITSSTFVDNWTGRSAGFSPLRMRPV
jgi:hypothetical protein